MDRGGGPDFTSPYLSKNAAWQGQLNSKLSGFQTTRQLKWVHLSEKPMVSSDYLYMSDDSAYYIAGQRIITERDIERWIEHCYNDSTEMDYGWISLSDTLPSGYVIKVSKWQHKDPNDIVGLLKWLKDK